MSDLIFFNNYNLKNTLFIPEKTKYRIVNVDLNKKVSKMTFKLNNVKMPFGVEKYNNKNIINLEFTNENNDDSNDYSKICLFDKYMKNLSEESSVFKLPNELLELIKTKQYMPIIKQRSKNYKPLLRTHVKGKLTEEIEGSKEKISVDIELGQLWTTQYHYGVIFYILNW
jgi:hypothetical protein